MGMLMDKDDYLVSGEKLKCSCGTQESELKTTVNKGVYIDRKLATTMADSLGEVNIGCFGQCMANPNEPKTCMFEGFWIEGSKTFAIEHLPALTKYSALICTKGPGVIVARDNKKIEEKYKAILATENSEEKLTYRYERFLKKMGLTVEDIKKAQKSYFKAVDEMSQEEKQFRKKLINTLGQNGIDSDWYSLDGDESKYISYSDATHSNSGRYDMVQIQGQIPKYFDKREDKIIDYMLEELLKYKKKFEFEQGITDEYIYGIELACNENGNYQGMDDKGKMEFKIYFYKELTTDEKEAWKKRGYLFSSYDYYNGYDVYVKKVDKSEFKEIIVKYQVRDEKGNVTDKEEKMIIPDELRKDIFEQVKETNNMNLCSFDLLEKVEMWLKR